MKFVLIICGTILFILVVLGGGWYAYRNQTQMQEASTPVYIPNPFGTSAKPNTSFGDTAPVAVNPFASPTPTSYQNPFSTTSTGGQPYQNPFEKLR